MRVDRHVNNHNKLLVSCLLFVKVVVGLNVVERLDNMVVSIGDVVAATVHRHT